MIVESAKIAFEKADSLQIIKAVNAYHQCLLDLGFVAEHSVKLITFLQEQDDVLAVKGCGAMGADVLLVIVPATELEKKCAYFLKQGLYVVANSSQLYDSSEK